jgi:hypothetical protein
MSTLPSSPLDYLINLDLQAQCKFELFLVRNPINQGALGANTNDTVGKINAAVNVATSIVGVAADLFVMKFHIQEITVPNEIKIEYERINGNKYAKNVMYPETINLKILADDAGLVRRYITQWKNEIMVPAGTRGVLGGVAGAVAGAVGGAAGGVITGLSSSLNSGGFPGEEGTYVFKDNQEAAKRTGMLLLKPINESAGLISRYPRIMMHGVVYQEMDDYNLKQDSSDPLMYNLTCSVDEVKIPNLL